MRRILLTLCALMALAVAGCGGDSHTRTVTVTTPAAPPRAAAPQTPSKTLLKHQCPPGDAYMGCSVLPSANLQLHAPLPVSASRPMFPDVSSWQGNVNWPAVAGWQRAHGWPTGGIFKMGEFNVDPFASSNSAGTRALSWRAGYWFVRNTGCQHEADQIITGARAYGLKVVWLDAEVPEARGYGLCLSPLLRKAGLLAGEYTAPGTNPGGLDTTDPLWEATFGSSFTPIWSPVVAWQCTDGASGCVTDVPGIGRDDVNIDLGISKLAGPPIIDPYAKYPNTLITFGADHARERTTVQAWDRSKCRNPVRRSVCKTTRAHLVLLLGRIDFIAGHKLSHGHWVTLKVPRWGSDKLGSRAAGIRSRLG